RGDGLEKVTGQARYAADLLLPGMLEGRFLLAGRPHARITRIDASRAESLPGVVAVITQADVPQLRYGSAVKDRTLFADQVVRFEGEVVAAVAARSAETAAAAIELIDVSFEPLPPVTDPETALHPASPLVHPDWHSYSAYDGIVRNGNDCAYVTIAKGDAAAGFAAADHVIEERYTCDQSHPVPIEPHAVVAQWQGEKVTIWSTSQVPFAARSGVAETLQMPESNVRIVVPHLGGGFGGKCEFHFEAHVAALARKAGRPVRVVFTRHDEFVAPDKVNHPIVIDLRTGVTKEGLMTARSARIVMDTGAYASDAPSIAEIATMMAAGPYDIPNLDIVAHTVYTNKTPAGSVRAPSGPQVAWAVEQHTDEVGKRVGLDGYDIRIRNLLEDGDEGPTGQRMKAVGAKGCLEKAASLIDYKKTAESGEGVGLACAWWFSFPAASSVSLKVNTDGSATIVTGAQENGSGAVMGLALIVADELGIDPDRVSILYQDTDAGSWDMGSSGSQTTFNNGRALIAAAVKIRARLLSLAAETMEVSPDDLEIVEGVVRVRGVPATAVSVGDLASRAFGRGELLTAQGDAIVEPLPENFGASCSGRVVFPAFADPTFTCQAVRVAVDRDTGVVRVKELVAAHDFGRVLNPDGARGQVEGGVLHSIGMALTEGSVYREGRQVNPHLLDYKLQTAADAPSIRVDFIETSGATGPRGAKGVGEPPIIAAAGAVGNAITAAAGVRVRHLPMNAPRVWAALNLESEP
ncbi:MAG TPA: xanthine dehydrogenase family protein molybdopterin-binding subunit, partial [Candidatus Dormibacteraeota bacterium]|nr:xanthine dehydrogenase family protein molybdopterin-binding subunit [Candidatus Dormibacteraeota bacterium]